MFNKVSPLPELLINRYKKWKLSSFLTNQKKFKELAVLGQNPLTMVISCCDSRVHVTSIFGADEGEFFIHRNIANLVPPYSLDFENHGTSAAIEYAIKELKIQNLIVLGHKDCGGIKTGHKLHSKSLNTEYEFINKWLNILLPAYSKINKDTAEEKQIDQLLEQSIKISLDNLLSFPYVKKAVDEKNLSIHGLIYDIGLGELKFLNPLTDKFESI